MPRMYIPSPLARLSPTRAIRIEVDVDQQAIPEALEEVEDQALLPIQEPEPDQITVHEVEGRAEVEGHPVPSLFEPDDPLIRRAEESPVDRPAVWVLPSSALLAR